MIDMRKVFFYQQGSELTVWGHYDTLDEAQVAAGHAGLNPNLVFGEEQAKQWYSVLYRALTRVIPAPQDVLDAKAERVEDDMRFPSMT